MNPTIEKLMNRNIFLMTIFFIANKRTFITFLMIFLLTMPDATAKTIGFSMMIGQAVGLLMEVPSGYISDKIGHKNALIISRLSMLLSTICFVFADNRYWIYLGLSLMSVATALQSGTVTAFLHDTLKVINRDDQYAKIIGKIRSIGFAVPIIFILLLPIIAETNYRHAFILAAIIDVVGLVVMLLLTVPPKEEAETEELKVSNFKKVFKTYISLPWFRYVILGSLAGSVVFAVTANFKQPYQEAIGFSLTMLGVLWAVSRVFISALLPFNGWFVKKFSLKQFMLLRVTVYSLSFIGVAFFVNKWLVAGSFILGNTFVWGLSSASAQYYLEFIKDKTFKATLLSLNSFMRNILNIVISGLSGYMVFFNGYRITFMVAGVACLAVALLALFILPRKSAPEVLLD